MLGKKPRVEIPVEEKNAFEGAINWESSRILTIEKSERRAWMVALTAVGTAAAAVLAVAMLAPLKETVPYVVRVDNTTGVPDIVTTIKDKAVTGDEVMDKYWLAKYIRARETYDWYTLQNDYNEVGLLSSQMVGKEYAQLFEGPNALDKQFGKTIQAKVKVISVVPTSEHTGTVRFIKTIKRQDEQNTAANETKWVATVSFEYRSTAAIAESDRLVNPFGFQVLSYRVDPEMIGGAE